MGPFLTTRLLEIHEKNRPPVKSYEEQNLLDHNLWATPYLCIMLKETSGFVLSLQLKYYYFLQEKDISTRVSEALIKILVAQICKDLPQSTRALLINPNEVSVCFVLVLAVFFSKEGY